MICRAMSWRPPLSSATSERSEDTQLSTWSSWFLSSSCCSGDRPSTTASTAATACCWASSSGEPTKEKTDARHVNLVLLTLTTPQKDHGPILPFPLLICLWVAVEASKAKPSPDGICNPYSISWVCLWSHNSWKCLGIPPQEAT